MIRLDLAAARRALARLPDDDPRAADETVARRFAAAVWSCLVEPGDGVAGALVEALGPAEALRMLCRDDAARAFAATTVVTPAEATAAIARWRPRLEESVVASAFTGAARVGARLVAPGDDAWPDRVDDLGTHAPMCLWTRGDVRVLSDGAPAIALVGARAATAYGTRVVAEMAAELAARDVTTVSGAAWGIDGAAHRATLAAGGATIAVLAGGVDRPYPAGHTVLLDDIVAHGAVVSEVPCGSAPTKWRFLQRNRVIAALSDATVVVEAGWRSGSLNTAGHAASLGRPLGAVPGPVTSAASAGCHRLLREYDARCITSADEALELLGIDVHATRGATGGHTDDGTRVRDALSSRAPRGVDVIAARAGMSPGDVESLLGFMLLDGSVERSEDGWRLA